MLKLKRKLTELLFDNHNKITMGMFLFLSFFILQNFSNCEAITEEALQLLWNTKRTEFLAILRDRLYVNLDITQISILQVNARTCLEILIDMEQQKNEDLLIANTKITAVFLKDDLFVFLSQQNHTIPPNALTKLQLYYIFFPVEIEEVVSLYGCNPKNIKQLPDCLIHKYNRTNLTQLREAYKNFPDAPKIILIKSPRFKISNYC